MDILQGNPTGIRSAAGDLAALKAAFEALDDALSEVLAHTDDAGNFPAGEKLRKVITTLRTTTRDGIVKQNDAKQALEALASRLDDIDDSARRWTAIPTVAGPAMAMEFRRQGNQERSETAAALLRCLPAGVPGRMVEYPGIGTTMKTVFNRGVKEPVEGLVGLAKFGWDTSPVRAAVDYDGYSQTMQEVTSTGYALYNAVVHDRFPDGSSGARQVVQDALSEIPDDLLNNDLIDTDPAAWWMLYGLTALSLFAGGTGGAKVGTKIMTSLEKGMGRTADLSKLGGVALNGARLSESPMSRVLADFPTLAARMERPVGSVPSGTWHSRVPGDYKGRLGIEDVVLDITRGTSPGMVALKPGHDVIDLMDVSLVDMSTGRIVSVKSLDPSMSSYQANPSSVGASLVKDADKLRNWGTPSTPGGTGVPFVRHDAFKGLGAERDTVFFMGDDLLTRDLYFALPDDGLNTAQAASLENAIRRVEQANAESGVTIHIHLLEIPR